MALLMPFVTVFDLGTVPVEDVVLVVPDVALDEVTSVLSKTDLAAVGAGFCVTFVGAVGLASPLASGFLAGTLAVNGTRGLAGVGFEADGLDAVAGAAIAVFVACKI